ncbi:unnamed protein product [Arabidopsis halleri]
MVFHVHKSWGARWKLSGSSYRRVELLRVLDLSGAKFKGRNSAHPFKIRKLKTC